MNIKSLNEYKVTVYIEDENFKKDAGIKTDSDNVYQVITERTTLSKEEFVKYINETDDPTYYSLKGLADKIEVKHVKSGLICVEVIIHTPHDVADLQKFYNNTKNPRFVAAHGIYRTLDEVKKLYKTSDHAIYVKGFGHLEKDNFNEFETKFHKTIANF